jgi:hypothetical protein
MRSDAVILARLERDKAAMDLLRSVIESPVVQVVAGYAFVEAQRKSGAFNPVVADGVEVALGAYLLLPQIANTAKILAPIAGAFAGAALKAP